MTPYQRFIRGNHLMCIDTKMNHSAEDRQYFVLDPIPAGDYLGNGPAEHLREIWAWLDAHCPKISGLQVTVNDASPMRVRRLTGEKHGLDGTDHLLWGFDHLMTAIHFKLRFG